MGQGQQDRKRKRERKVYHGGGERMDLKCGPCVSIDTQMYSMDTRSFKCSNLTCVGLCWRQLFLCVFLEVVLERLTYL